MTDRTPRPLDEEEHALLMRCIADRGGVEPAARHLGLHPITIRNARDGGNVQRRLRLHLACWQMKKARKDDSPIRLELSCA